MAIRQRQALTCNTGDFTQFLERVFIFTEEVAACILNEKVFASGVPDHQQRHALRTGFSLFVNSRPESDGGVKRKKGGSEQRGML